MYVKYLNGTVVELVKAKFTKTIVQTVDITQVPPTDVSIVRRLGLKWQEWVIKGAVTLTSSVMWRDIAQVSLDNASWRNCVTTTVDFPRILIDQTLYELRLNVSPILEGAVVRYPSSGYKWGKVSITGISQAGNVNAYPIIHFLAPLFYAPLSNTLVDFAGQSVTFTRYASKVHAGVTYPINVPIFDNGLYISAEIAQDEARLALPSATVRTIAMQLKSRYPSLWVIGTGSPANLITNGEFEANTTGWYADSGTLSRYTSPPLVGTGSLKFITGGNHKHVFNNMGGFTVGHTYSLHGLMQSFICAAGRKAWAFSYDATLGFQYGTAIDVSVSAGEVSVIFTAGATTEWICFGLDGYAAGEIFLLDNAVCIDLTTMCYRNLLTANQSNAETDTTGMTSGGGTFTRNTASPLVGTGSFKIVSTGSNDIYFETTTPISVAAGQWYTVQALCKVTSAANRSFRFAIEWITAIGGSTYVYGPTLYGPFPATVMSATLQCPATAVTAKVWIIVNGALTGEILESDSFMLEAIPVNLSIWAKESVSQNNVRIDTVNNLIKWFDGTDIFAVVFPTGVYLNGAVTDIVFIDDTAHAVTVAVHAAGGSWVSATGLLAGLAWDYIGSNYVGNIFVLGQYGLGGPTHNFPLEGSIANLIMYPYALTSAEYQAILLSLWSLSFNTLYIGNKYAGEIIKGSDKRLLNALGSDISALLGGTDIPIGASAVTIAQSQGMSARWYVEVKRTDV